MQKLNLSNIQELISIIELSNSDVELSSMIDDFKELVSLNSFEELYNTEQVVKSEVDASIDYFNELLENGALILNTKELQPPSRPDNTIEPKHFESTEQEIDQILGRLDRSEENTSKTLLDINPMLQDEHADDELIQQNKKKKPYISDKLRNYTPLTNKINEHTTKPPTTGTAYTFETTTPEQLIPKLSPADKKTVQEINLESDKIYIYRALRGLLGEKISPESVLNYGSNRIARKIISMYPSGYQRTVIQHTIKRITDYVQLVS